MDGVGPRSMTWVSLVAQLVKTTTNHLQCRRPQFNSCVGKIHWRRDRLPTPVFLGFPCGSIGKEFTCGTPGFYPWVGKIPWRREWLPTPVFWPGEFHGLHSPWGRKESDTTKRLSLINDTEEESLAACLSNRSNPMVLTCFPIEEFGNICRAGGNLHLRVPPAQRFCTAMF